MAIHIVTSGKGNVGKSSFSSALATVAATAGANPCLMDADDQKQTLSKLYGKGTARVKLSEDPVYEEQPDTIWYTAKKTGREVIVDLAAQTDLYINYWLDNRGILNAAESDNIRIIKWWVADLDPDSFVDLAALCKKYDSKQVTHVLVKSYYRGRDSLWLKTEEENDNLIEAKKNGLQVIEFPRMFEGLIDKLRAREQTFQQVLLDQKHEHTDMLNRSTVMNWMRSCTAQIEKIYQFTPDKTETQKPEGDEKNKTAKAKAKAKV